MSEFIYYRCNFYRHIALLFFLLLPAYLTAQQIKKKFILRDDHDSMLVNACWKTFDENGNYLFGIRTDSGDYFINKSGKTTALKFSSGSRISVFQSRQNNNEKYYLASSCNLFGPFWGENLNNFRQPMSENDKHFAMSDLSGDSIAIFADGRLIAKCDTFCSLQWSINGKKASPLQAKKIQFESNDWLSFSNNGNYIFSIENHYLHRLFVNEKLVDSSSNSFQQFRINSNGDYLYAEGRRPSKKSDDGYDYMFFIHINNRIFGPVRTVWSCELRESGGYYYSGDDNGTYYILIDNVLYKNISPPSNIIIVDSANYFFTWRKGDSVIADVKGLTITVPAKDILCPSLDSAGNFAFYGIIDHYLFSFVNGVKSAIPITKYGVRAIPIYISPTGESLHYFETDDSVYIYCNDKLILHVFSTTENFSVDQYADIAPTYYNHKSGIGKSLLYVEIGDSGYWVYNGQFSHPTLSIKKANEESQKYGWLVASNFDEKGFFAIQNTGKKSFSININNTVYREINDVDNIIQNSCYFDGNRLVFVGIEGLSFYQYSIQL